MSSLLGHGLAGVGLWALARRTPALQPLGQKAWLAGAAVAACLPDADALVGLPHRGPTHTLGFALAMGAAAGLAAALSGLRPRSAMIGLIGAGIVWSHPLLDLLTGGGPDVGLFRPFLGRKFRPVAGGLPLTGYTSDVGGIFGLLADPGTVGAMLVEAAVFGPLCAASLVPRPGVRIGLALSGAGVWAMRALFASR